jgi:hypothetical protein
MLVEEQVFQGFHAELPRLNLFSVYLKDTSPLFIECEFDDHGFVAEFYGNIR